MKVARNRKKLWASGVSAACVLALSACSSGNSDDTIKVGVVQAMSGVSEVLGKETRQGVDVCVEYANGELGLNSTIEVEYADGQGVPAASVTAMNKLVNVGDVDAVITGFSAVVKAVAPIANQNKVVTFNAGASSPEIRELGDYIFNVVPLADEQVPVMADYIVNEKGLSDWYLVHSNETLGESMKEALESYLPSAGGELVGTSEVTVDQTDFGAQVAKIRAADPDVVYLASAADVSVLVRQARVAGIDAQFASYSNMDTANMRKEEGAEGSLYTAQSVELESNDPLTDYFTTEYVEKHGTQPTTTALNNCQALMTIAQAAKALEDQGTEVNGESLREAILEQKTFDAVGGEITYDDDGMVANQRIAITELRGGESVLAKTAD